MSEHPTVLAVLLEGRGLHRYGSFCAAYHQAAGALDKQLARSVPSRAQFHRWLTGELRGLPYTDHCRVLEHMLAGYSAQQLSPPAQTGPSPLRRALHGNPPPPRRPRGLLLRVWPVLWPCSPADRSSPPRLTQPACSTAPGGSVRPGCRSISSASRSPTSSCGNGSPKAANCPACSWTPMARRSGPGKERKTTCPATCRS